LHSGCREQSRLEDGHGLLDFPLALSFFLLSLCFQRTPELRSIVLVTVTAKIRLVDPQEWQGSRLSGTGRLQLAQ
jgi:hypothetical protein